MTACAIESATRDAMPGSTPDRAGRTVPTPFTISVNGAYAARLAGVGEALFPERWTLDGPEPYAVPLPLHQPEQTGTDLLPLTDGRVLIRRRAGGRHLFSLLYPVGAGTGELPIGGIETAELLLLPPSPDGDRVYAIAPGDRATAIWLVAGGAFGPEQLAVVPGRCSGGVWLDRLGRMLALDRRLDGGPLKTVAVDLLRAGEVSPLLQIAPASDDRLLLADTDSGLLVIRSNAPGQDRLGWGVLGSALPVRFPECLHPADSTVRLTPFAAQPGQVLMPERCGVALHISGPTVGGTTADRGDGTGVPALQGRLAVWRPEGRRLHPLPVPEGWLAGAGVWSREGVLRLPYTTGLVPCGVARIRTGGLFTAGGGLGEACGRAAGAGTGVVPSGRAPSSAPPAPAAQRDGEGGPRVRQVGTQGVAAVSTAYRPIPLQQAPLIGRIGPG